MSKKKFLFYLSFVSFFIFIFVFNLKTSSPLINNYQFLGSDSFDWIFQGKNLYNRLSGKTFFYEIPVLRNPIFVFFSTLDSFLGEKGLVFFIINSLSFCITIIIIFELVRFNLNLSTSYNFFLFLSIFTLFTYNYFSYWYLFIMADPLAICLGIISFYLIFFKKNKKKLIFLLMLTSGLTQLYAIIPSLILLTYQYCYLQFKYKLFNKKNYFLLKHFFKKNLLFFTCLFASIFLMQYLWGSYFDGMRPGHFKSLQLSFNMIHYYKHVWLTHIFPLFVHLFFFKFYKDRLILSTLLISIIFLILTFFYQWSDSRFTLMYWPYILIFILRLTFLQKKKIAIFSLILFYIIFQNIEFKDYKKRFYGRNFFSILANKSQANHLKLKYNNLYSCYDYSLQGHSNYRTKILTHYIQIKDSFFCKY